MDFSRLVLPDRYVMCQWLYYIPPPMHAPPAETAAYRSWPHWDHLVSLTKLLFNFLLTGYFLWWKKTLAQLVIISQALRTLTLNSLKVRSQVLFWNICVLYIKVEQKWRNIHQCVTRRTGKTRVTHWSSVTLAS